MICIYEATFYVNQFHKDIVLLKTIAIRYYSRRVYNQSD